MIMKPNHQIFYRLARLLSAAMFLVSIPLGAPAQSYAIHWHTMDGGGGTSTGGNYSLSATIGQPDAGTMSGGAYAIKGGFWGGFGLAQVTGAPRLSIEATTQGALISWESATPGFVLQYNDDLATTNWIYADSGTTNPVVAPPTPGIRFFRLHKP
jgi:hypothetical protein